MIIPNCTEREVKIIIAVGNALQELMVKGHTRHQTFARLVQSWVGRNVSIEEIEEVLNERFLYVYASEVEEKQ